MALYCNTLHVARNAVKTKDGSVLLCFLASKVEINNVFSKDCKIMEDTTIWCVA